MATILTITFTNTLDNYGQVLQYLATQEFLGTRGHSVSVHEACKPNYSLARRTIRWGKAKARNLLSKLKKMVSHGAPAQTDCVHTTDEIEKQKLFDKWRESSLLNDKEHPRYFAEFRETYFHFLRCPIEDLPNLRPDVCLVGSDQVWSWVGEYNFLKWAPKFSKRLSLASSIGNKSFSATEIQQAKRMLADFDLVTVREDNGVVFAQQADRADVQKILDPTFLLSVDDYAHWEESLAARPPYILLYLLGGDIGISVDEVYTYAKSRGMEVVYVASQGREDGYPKCYAKVGEWLALIHHADCIFTNSFHGMVFSLIYRKPFLVFPRVGIMSGMNGRIVNLAKEMGVERHLYSCSLETAYEPIDEQMIVSAIRSNLMKVESLLENIGL